MKRDWDLIRKQLTDIEEENDVLADLPGKAPKWDQQSEADFMKEMNEYSAQENRVFGHLEMLVENGYVDGLHIMRGADGHFSYSRSSPRLTMAGHDLLDTMRSKPIWDKIKEGAKSRGVELTFDTIKALGALAVGKLLGTGG